MHFYKPPVLFKSPLLAKSSLNLYKLYYISFCSHRSNHSGLWRQRPPAGPFRKIVISAFFHGLLPPRKFPLPAKSLSWYIQTVMSSSFPRFYALCPPIWPFRSLVVAPSCRSIPRRTAFFPYFCRRATIACWPLSSRSNSAFCCWWAA